MLTIEEFAVRKQQTISDLQKYGLAESPEALLVAISPLLDDGTLADSDVTAIKAIALGTVHVGPTAPRGK